MFASLTVEENLTLSVPPCARPHGVPGALARAYEAFPRLGERRTQSAGTLSGGEQRMLALARVLVLHQKLLVVDELSFGLAPVVVDEVYAALGRVLAAGTSLLLIEQHVDRALVLADDVVVLSKGRVVYDGPVAGVEGRLGDLVLGRPDRAGASEPDRVGGHRTAPGARGPSGGAGQARLNGRHAGGDVLEQLALGGGQLGGRPHRVAVHLADGWNPPMAQMSPP